MLSVPSRRETVSEMIRRHSRLDDYSRLREMSRRFYTDRPWSPSRALSLADDMYDVPGFSSPHWPWHPSLRRHFFKSKFGRDGLPDFATRMAYNKRLAHVADQRDSWRKTEALLLCDYFHNTRAILGLGGLPTPARAEDLELAAYDESNAEDDGNPNDNDDIFDMEEVEDEARKRRANEREALKERAKIVNLMRDYRRRHGPSRFSTRTMRGLAFDI